MSLAAEIRAALVDAADPTRAAGQQAYMKSALPFYGVQLPAVRAITKTRIRGIRDAEELSPAADELWNNATHREELYAAMAILAAPVFRRDVTLLGTVEHMVLTGRWWDITDELSHRVAALHDVAPEETGDTVRRWSIDADMWLRRSAIISQLGRRDRLDRGLLTEVIEPNLTDSEFFIRKAIGWSLREYARTEPDWVREFVNTHAMSPLSVREALKHIGA